MKRDTTFWNTNIIIHKYLYNENGVKREIEKKEEKMHDWLEE